MEQASGPAAGDENLFTNKSMEVQFDPRGFAGHMPLDDLEQYGQVRAREIQERRQRRRVADEKASVDDKLKTVWAPRLWLQVRQEMQQLVSAINDALGEPVLECDQVNSELVILRVAEMPSNLSAAFDPSLGKIILTLDDHLDTYTLEVVRGEVKLKAVGYFSPVQVAKMLVDKAASMVL
jgi:hypothetical protein